MTDGQRLALLGLVAGLGVWAYLDLLSMLIALNASAIAFYLVLTAYKLLLIDRSLGWARQIEVPPEELAALDEAELPVYTILVPLYHETESLPHLVSAIDGMDYPKAKLDVILLLESDDTETVAMARSMDLPGHYRLLVVPDFQPKTKPKACNLGLAEARGEFLVIFDAEDRPEADQLKKAVAGFGGVGPEVVCLQAKLNFYNQRHNLLTRLFTVEYSMWFDLYLPGMDTLGSPIPLGGTSNHFRVEALRELAGWDPFNVTEDADLGIRLKRRGLETRVLDSTTWEEACSHAGFWLKQRSRWAKGYMQTYLVHTRKPMTTLRRLSLRGIAGLHLNLGGTPLCLLLNPIYWTLTLLWFVFRTEAVGEVFPFAVFAMGAVCLFVGNFAFVYSGMLAAYRRSYFDLVKFTLLLPAYWLMMSVAAWKGFWQLIVKPFYWEKTKHGLTQQS